ncbi:TPA: hypothetical protein TVE81_001378 [Streptococcus equi subsp. zooepidemicus]|uniref:hypothetical protein n=1 Tax=Streptococcus equi TaxID=1336 RepID=UPI0013F607FB|nr:hypothetical protein [Streptococcus equi]MCD3381676.1 hypothetical protein [Streptococcus equi subsp. zooepidemicus]MCD3406682.1 hypothetical protein [Streptococcus equi subsp. zooepidemicus]QUQ78126.1 hypothetical protein JDBNIEOD_01156 [Streptococcus equi subsp. zooepidemicus]HEK9985471.1 hypothetical protein [Streptococcus equi subsp. zooepidemicus]HEL0637892.1 hypothetical protein [Streptococcus equi subsp. zooepidemicus]
MVEVISKPLNLEKIVTIIKQTGIPCFDMSIGRDEVYENKTFFVYIDDGELMPALHANQYHKQFTLMFITRENRVFNELELIENLKLCRLIFDSSEVENGQLVNTEEKAIVRTYYFHQLIKIER